MSDLLQTPLHGLHVELGARMVPFAGYDMPVQYALGVMKEHLHCRARAGLFDVSHMGQVIVRHADGFAGAAAAMEALVPVSILALGENRQRYGFFTNDAGGIMDDLMLANRGDHLFVVVNAACKDADIAHMRTGLAGCEIEEITDRALLALQGPEAEAVLEALVPGVAAMTFMDVAVLPSAFGELWISRSGYTGEDGFEISVPVDQAAPLAQKLLEHPDVAPIGLGARDSLRLEAGLCLYGHDIDAQTTPVEAGLTWAIQKTRRQGGARAGGFPGAATILPAFETGPARRRVGLRPEGRAPMREGVLLFADEASDQPIGSITSGGFGPTVGAPVAMGYVDSAFSAAGTALFGELRGKRLPLSVAPLPFVPANFKR